MSKKFSQGIYSPINRQKYVGKDDPRFLSSWELKFFSWCDLNQKVLKWSSEKVVIPYVDPTTATFDLITKKRDMSTAKTKNYFVDALITVSTPEGNKNYLIEIKPFRETIAPKNSKRKKPSTLLYEQITWEKNQAKWAAARIWSFNRKCTFVIFTENELEKMNIL